MTILHEKIAYSVKNHFHFLITDTFTKKQIKTMKKPQKILLGLLACYYFSVSASAQPKVTFPNGGETLKVGSTVNITWSGTPLNTEVGIDYTIDNWVNTIWLNTSYKNPAANSYSWTIPNTPGTKCKVGVFNTAFEGDISDNYFIIEKSTSSINEENKSINMVSITPNPSKGGFRVHNPLNATLHFKLYDITGRMPEVQMNDDRQGVIYLENQSLQAGLYFLEIRDEGDGKFAIKKILVEN